MNANQVEAFRRELVQLKQEIESLGAANKEAGDTVALDQSKVGRLSRMDAMQGQQMAQETARRRKLHLQRIETALRKIESGNYGTCAICEEPIGEARLDFDPASTRCITCMDKE